MTKKLAVIAYTTFSTDTRVQKETYAALEAGYSVDLFSLKDAGFEEIENLNFYASSFFQYKGQNKISYIMSYVKFFFFCLFSLSSKGFSQKYSYVHIHNMPNFLVFSALVPKLLGTKLILDIHDLMPEIFSVKFKLSLDHWIIKLLYFEERISAKFVNQIIATNSFHVKRFRKNKIVKKEVTEIINVADENIFYHPENKNFFEGTLKIAYPSTIAKRLGINNLIDAIKLLKSKNYKIQLNIYGDGEYKEEVKQIILEKKLDDVIKLSDTFLPLKELSKEMDKAHLGIIPLPSNPSNDIAMPVKIYEFFAKQICVVATEIPLLKNTFNESIIFFESESSKDLADKIEMLYHDREKLEQYAQKGYNYFKSKTWSYYNEEYKKIIS